MESKEKIWQRRSLMNLMRRRRDPEEEALYGEEEEPMEDGEKQGE